MEDKLFCTPEATLVSTLRYQKLQNCFSALTKREQTILGGIYGVFDYEKVPVTELAIRNRMKESGVEKAKKAALKKLKDKLSEDDLYDKVQMVRRMLHEGYVTIQLPQQLYKNDLEGQRQKMKNRIWH